MSVYYRIDIKNSEIICTVHWIIEKSDTETNKTQCYNGMILFSVCGYSFISSFLFLLPKILLTSTSYLRIASFSSFEVSAKMFPPQ